MRVGLLLISSAMFACTAAKPAGSSRPAAPAPAAPPPFAGAPAPNTTGTGIGAVTPGVVPTLRPPSSSLEPAGGVVATPPPKPCGAAGCLAFDSVESAFSYVLDTRPRVLAIGEAHAQKGTESVASTTTRFTSLLLPLLSKRASDLVVELWVANGRCGKVEGHVAEQQRPITQNQASSNQSEFLALGQRAQSFGITPHALTPTCEEYALIAGAGASDVDRMLQMIAAATARELDRLLDQQTAAAPNSLLVAYGGALHNDLFPRPGRERWSFGPELDRRTHGAYVELDLIVPEYVKDNESWRAFPWYTAYDPAHHGKETLLFSPAPRSFALVFPRST